MKRLSCLWVLLCPFGLFAQTTATIRPLNIGDTVPDLVFRSVLHGPGGRDSVRLRDYAGQAVLLDFWATWCGPCIKGMPKLDSLYRQFRGDLLVLSVTGEQRSIVEPFFQRRPTLRLPCAVVTDDDVIHQYFPHRVIPHAIVIGRDRVVRAITTAAYIDRAVIARALNGSTLALPVKKDQMAYRYNQPYFTRPETPVFRYSVVAPRVEGLSSHSSPLESPEGAVQGLHYINTAMAQLFLAGMGKPGWYWNSRTILEGVADSSRYLRSPALSDGQTTDWNRQHTFCYEQVSPGLTDSARRVVMQADLAGAFRELYGVEAQIAVQRVSCYYLQRVGEKKTPVPTGPATRNRSLAFQLENTTYFRILDATGGVDAANLPIPKALFMGVRRSRDITPLRSLLQQHGYDLVPGMANLEVLLLSESVSSSAKTN